MTELLEPTAAPPEPPAPAVADLATALQSVLAASGEPLTLPKLRSRLPAPFRHAEAPEVVDLLQRQVAAGVLFLYPKYRSPHDRYWDRGMAVHVAALIHETLADGPLPLSQLRRRLPSYAQSQTETILNEQLQQGLLHRHPRTGSRDPERFAVSPADPKDYLRRELPALFGRLAGLGFTRDQLRAAALELLHDEEWDPDLPSVEEPRQLLVEAAEPLPLAGPHAVAALAEPPLPPDVDVPHDFKEV